MRLELSRRAQADLDDIRDYSVEQFGLERAILYLNLIQQAFPRLFDYPYIRLSRYQFAAKVLSYPVRERANDPDLRTDSDGLRGAAPTLQAIRPSGGLDSGHPAIRS